MPPLPPDTLNQQSDHHPSTPPAVESVQRPYRRASSSSSSGHRHANANGGQSEDIKPESGGETTGPKSVPPFHMPTFKLDDLHEPQKIMTIDLLKNALCVDCHSVLMTEIHNCTSGHLACKKCTRNLQFCSVCSELRTKIRVAFVENMVVSLKYKCTRRDLGCVEILSFIDIQRHLTDDCAFRPVPCFVDNENKGLCTGQLYPFDKFAAHVKQTHTPPEMGKLTWRLLSDSVTQNFLWPVACIAADGQLFFINGAYEDSVAYVWVTMFDTSGLHIYKNYLAGILLCKIYGPGQKTLQMWENISVQPFRKPFHQIKAEKACMTLSKEEYLVLSSHVMTGGGGGDGGTLNDDVIICKYSWTLKVTIAKNGVKNGVENGSGTPEEKRRKWDLLLGTRRGDDKGHEPKRKERHSHPGPGSSKEKRFREFSKY